MRGARLHVPALHGPREVFVLKSVLVRLIPFLLVAAAAWVLWRELHHLNPAAVLASIVSWGPWRIGGALALAGCSYGFLVANEQVALRWAGTAVDLKTGVPGSFIAYALANNLGLGMLVGGAFRASAYAPFGVTLAQVAQVTAYGTVTFSLGVAALAGGLLLRAPTAVYQTLHLDPGPARLIGLLMLAALVVYVVGGALLPQKFRIARFSFRRLVPTFTLLQIAFGVADVALGAALVWLLLGHAAPDYPAVLTAYLVSLMAGLLSGVPGGVGIFESVMLTLLPSVNRAELTASLLGFRLFFYLVPLITALGMLLIRRITRRKPQPVTQPLPPPAD
jgi:uncharacterized membrane protein YbhN (UPF0104 family)